MRFGIVTPRVGRNDGQGRVNLEVAAEMLRQGHEVTLFCEHADGAVAASPLAHPVTLPPPAWLPSRLLRDQALAWRSAARLRGAAHRLDAVLANGFVSWARSDVNAVHFVHGAWVRSPVHPWRVRRGARSLYARAYGGVNTLLERAALRRSRVVVAVSDKVRRELAQAGIPAARIRVILNGVDAEEFRPGAPERPRFGLPDGPKLALFAGDLRTPRKNLDTVLRAMAELPGLHLAVAGRTEGSPYPALARALGVQARVHFVGFQTDMPALMRSADLFVFPSRYEACSLVLLEAMASGLPVLTARSAGGAELVVPEAGVVLDDSDDAAGLAAAMRAMLADPARRAAMGNAARRLACGQSWRAMAGQYLDLMSEAAERRRAERDARA